MQREDVARDSVTLIDQDDMRERSSEEQYHIAGGTFIDKTPNNDRATRLESIVESGVRLDKRYRSG